MRELACKLVEINAVHEADKISDLNVDNADILKDGLNVLSYLFRKLQSVSDKFKKILYAIAWKYNVDFLNNCTKDFLYCFLVDCLFSGPLCRRKLISILCFIFDDIYIIKFLNLCFQKNGCFEFEKLKLHPQQMSKG